MGIEAHLQSLEQKHSDLESKINAAQASPSTNDLEIVDLKRKKLVLKEEIEKLKMQNV